MNKETIILVSFKLEGDDPMTSLARVLSEIKHPDIIEIEVLDDEILSDDDFKKILEDDDYDYFDDLMGEV